jgi:hypothetical protein
LFVGKGKAAGEEKIDDVRCVSCVAVLFQKIFFFWISLVLTRILQQKRFLPDYNDCQRVFVPEENRQGKSEGHFQRQRS